MAKSREKQLADALHERGLRKRVARSVAGALGSGNAKRPPAQVARVADDLRGLAVDLENRATGRNRKRPAAARTRARNAEKRSVAARKAGRKRSTSSPRTKARAR